ncbi:NAD(P)-dependent oxidoreductase [Tomitella biformata]|uniref:NAD(P)-dependent oxidoreductase n=1 Tax=Tomitella biformata TaxID=630403 RepID=UPI0004662711|nr:NAD(P)-binding domain-containing protein [Tomitella biformata]
MTSTAIGFIGTGLIGEPMVEQLLAAGRPTTVYARRAEVGDRLAHRGAVSASRPADLAAAPIVLACLFSDGQVLEVCPPIIAAMRPGSVFISHTTGSPVTTRRLAELALGSGVSIVEAPFSGNAAAIRRRDLTVLLAGEADGVEIAADVVAAYASTVLRTGGLGTALAAKLLNNALFAACSQLTLTAIEAGRTLGLDENRLLEVLAVSSGGSTAGRYIADSPQDSRAYSARLPRYLSKDLASVRQVAADLGVDIGDLLAAAERGPLDLD